MTKITILDGYVDEPTCLGVPPYISPYPRYIAGAIYQTNPELDIQYRTIDQIRQNKNYLQKINQSELLIIIAGMAVPGRYLSGYPLQPSELKRILQTIHHPQLLLCGPAARYGFGIAGGKKTEKLSSHSSPIDACITGDPEIVISNLIKNNGDINAVDLSKQRPNSASIGEFAEKGAALVTQHPYFPHYLLAEIETYRGCPRSITKGCSFCTEPLKGPPDFRPISHIIKEINALYKQGIRHFRIGNQPCLFTYMAKDAAKKEIPKPNPDALETLFSQIRTVAPKLKTLHIDNVNPGVVARFPQESKQIIETIIQHHTPGDVAAFGVESLDPAVIQHNNLKANEQQIIEAITLFNKYGKKRGTNGLPELLPGINLVFGLKGETKKTYTINYTFLQEIIKKNLLIRRINIRQVLPLPDTPMEAIENSIIKKHKPLFKHFKYNVKHHIEQPLLKTLVPKDTILTKVISELWKGKTTFGRQLGSYPLLVGIPGQFPLYNSLDVIVIDHGYRSITALPYPVPINTAQRETIQHLPFIGKKRTNRILLQRPFHDKKEFSASLDDPHITEKIIPYLSFQQ